MSCISLLMIKVLFRYVFLECFTMFIIGILAILKCDICSFVNGSY